jgi:thiol-disulfide isomerase/thioredoxin
MEGEIASDFVLYSLEGKQVTLSSFEGKPVFLNFWATWCGPCKMEMPDMELLKKSFGDKIEILGVNEGESPAQVEAFVRENGYSWTFLTDADRRVGDQYRVSGYPTSVFINAEGRISGRRVGMMTGEDMERQIQVARGNEEGGFKTRFLTLATDLQNNDHRIKSVEVTSNIAALEYALVDGVTHKVLIFERQDDRFKEGLIELQVPSYDLDEAPVSDLEGYLLNWNLDYTTGAWAVDKHNNRLTLVAKYRGKMLDRNFFGIACSEMVNTVDKFERMINKLMVEEKQ